MPSVTSIMAELKKKGSEKTRKMYARHGMATERMFGVSIADLKAIAKTIKGQQRLACELYETGNLDAMYLAGLVADGSQMTKKQLNGWAEGAANLHMISEYTVPWVTVGNPDARELGDTVDPIEEGTRRIRWLVYLRRDSSPRKWTRRWTSRKSRTSSKPWSRKSEVRKTAFGTR